MDTAASAFWGGAFFALVVLFVGRALFKAVRGPRTGTEAQSGAEITDPQLRKLYRIATQLSQFASVAAHPRELLKHDLFEKGVACLLAEKFTDDDLFDYAGGENGMLACIAVETICRRLEAEDYTPRLLRLLGKMQVWPMSFALRNIAANTPASTQTIGVALVEGAGQLWNEEAVEHFDEFIEKRIEAGEKPAFGDALRSFKEDNAYNLEIFLKGIRAFDTSEMLRELAGRQTSTKTSGEQNDGILNSVGQVWGAAQAAQAAAILAHPAIETHIARLEASLKAAPPKSTLVVGPAGVGKSSIIQRLSQKLHKKGWTIFVAGHTELIAGQSYIGEFEGQLRRVIEDLKARKRALWIVPGLEALAFSGMHRFNAVSALDMLLPYIESGEIRIAAEMSNAAYERLLLIKPRVASCFTIERVTAMSAADTLKLGSDWLKRNSRTSDATVAGEAWQLAQHFLGELSPPGNLLKLLQLTGQRLSRERTKKSAGDIAITRDALFETLIGLTGLSAEMLDESKSLDIDALREHFHRRVIGQDEAVNCLVERITMIKAGVTDPTRPAGVFLFAGPTGTGKTEIAKTLAEWLFGSPQRMIRIDMSELQTADTLARLIGSDVAMSDALTDKIREQPFSVILLDEFEKAHPAIWDFFLQVFDDGRLTDAQGRTADFRYAIIILTSNLGAAVPTDAPMGFAGVQGGFDPSTVTAEIEKVFRREFVNRIDRVIVFRPLSREVMREILQKELDLAFQRRGLRTRSWAVEWDDAAMDFLLDQGFTPDLGARPLKRAVDRHLLAPLAQTIVRGQVPAGDQFLFVTERDGGLHVEFVDPDAPEDEGVGTVEASDGDAARRGEPTLKSIMFSPQGTAVETRRLAAKHRELADIVASPGWTEEKQANLALMQLPDFWNSKERFDILGKVECIDRIEAATRRAGSLLQRLPGGGGRKRGTVPRDLVRSLAQTLYLVEVAHGDLAEDRPREAFLQVEAGRSGTGGQDAATFAARLADMYLSWAKSRRMTYKVIEDRRPPEARGCTFTMAVSGFGAHTILAPEEGLHVLEEGTGKSQKAPRIAARVSVAPQSSAPEPSGPKELRKRAHEALASSASQKRKVVRHYRQSPSPLVRDTQRGWRTGRIDRVLDGSFDLIE